MYSLYVLGFSINRVGQTVKTLFVKTRNLYGKSRVGKLKSRPWRVCSGNFGGRGSRETRVGQNKDRSVSGKR